MASTSVEIFVSRQEAERPRLLQVLTVDQQGRVLTGVPLQAVVDVNGSFSDAVEMRERSLVTSDTGAVFLQWFEWPRHGVARDFASTVTISWPDESVVVYLENLYE
jgi:hypothetical protein